MVYVGYTILRIGYTVGGWHKARFQYGRLGALSILLQTWLLALLYNMFAQLLKPNNDLCSISLWLISAAWKARVI